MRLADPDHGLRQAARVHLCLRRRRREPTFDIEDRGRPMPAGELVGHDGRRRSAESTRCVAAASAQGVELAVRRYCELRRSVRCSTGRSSASRLAGLPQRSGRSGRPGTDSELVERAAGVARARGPDIIGHYHARGCRTAARDDQAGLVAHAAGGVLVHLHAGTRRRDPPCRRSADMHSVSAADLAVGHAREVARPSRNDRHLVIGNFIRLV